MTWLCLPHYLDILGTSDNPMVAEAPRLSQALVELNTFLTQICFLIENNQALEPAQLIRNQITLSSYTWKSWIKIWGKYSKSCFLYVLKNAVKLKMYTIHLHLSLFLVTTCLNIGIIHPQSSMSFTVPCSMGWHVHVLLLPLCLHLCFIPP